MQKVIPILKGIPKSYAQVFFSDNLIFGLILMGTSFLDSLAGICGLLAILTANGAALLLGFSKERIHQGLYGYNCLLVGLGTGLSFQPGFQLYLVVFFSALLTLFLTLAIEGVLFKYHLPFLSFPFVLGIWTVIISCKAFGALGISERGIYTANELYSIGGPHLVAIYDWFQGLAVPLVIRTYLFSIGAIFFQTNLLAGALISFGLLLFSRIAFLLSLLGFGIAWSFYWITGASLQELSYTYIGFNYILTAIAIGGIFLVPTRSSFLLVGILLPMVIMITLAMEKLFALWQLPIYSLPFNIMVPITLFILKRRATPQTCLREVEFQYNSPERNLYFDQGNRKRLPPPWYLPVSLPFFGEWSVSQGNEGPYTHQGEWKYAWDFVITDEKNKTYIDTGTALTHYLCYGKPVCAPADGIIAEIKDGIPDNNIGEVNTLQNWGNTVVIRHSDYLFSQVSHLKKDSIKVKKGEFVKTGQLLGICGNSGRSPYPHLHLQFQAYPKIGAPTIPYFFSQYLRQAKNGKELQSFTHPGKEERVANIQTTQLLFNALRFTPGQKITLRVQKNELQRFKNLPTVHHWKVNTDVLNQTHIISESTSSTAWIYNNEQVHYFSHYTGKRDSLLFLFFTALFKVPLGSFSELRVQDRVPPNLVFKKGALFLQDWVAPFFTFLKADYNLLFEETSHSFSPEEIHLASTIRRTILGYQTGKMQFRISISRKGIDLLEAEENGKKLMVKWEED